MDRRDRSGRRDQEIRSARQIPLRCLSLAVEEGRLPTCPFQLEAAEPRSAPGRGSRCSLRPVTANVRLLNVNGGVPSGVEIEKWRILPVGSPTTNRPSGKTAAGGMRHGEAYQEVGGAARGAGGRRGRRGA